MDLSIGNDPKTYKRDHNGYLKRHDQRNAYHKLFMQCFMPYDKHCQQHRNRASQGRYSQQRCFAYSILLPFFCRDLIIGGNYYRHNRHKRKIKRRYIPFII